MISEIELAARPVIRQALQCAIDTMQFVADEIEMGRFSAGDPATAVRTAALLIALQRDLT